MADEEGGAIYFEMLTLDITGSHFIDNQAGQNGGAIHMHDPMPFTLHNNTFCGNNSFQDGGAISVEDDWDSQTIGEQCLR